MGNHRQLHVWQRAQSFGARLDGETRQLARGYAPLADQLRRASLSIPTNLAEGACRGRDGEFIRYVGIAIGSAAEVDSLLAHVAAVGALDSRVSGELAEDLTVIRKMLFRLRSALQSGNSARSIRTEPTDHRPEPIDHEP